MRLKIALLLTVVLLSSATAAAQQGDSVYSDLAAKKCKTLSIQEDEGSGSVQECPGVAGYKLLVEEGDLRQSITVVAPDGSKHELSLWSVVSSAFSTVGDRAEWRVRRRGGRLEPYALIVRFNASESPENVQKTTSYLAVARLAPGPVCVTDKIKPSSRANVLARQAADASGKKPCMSVD